MPYRQLRALYDSEKVKQYWIAVWEADQQGLHVCRQKENL